MAPGKAARAAEKAAGTAEAPAPMSVTPPALGAGPLRSATAVAQVYQVMNPNPSDVDTIEFENPFAPFVIPFAVGTAAAGGVQMGVRYRRQKLPLR